MRNRCPAGIPNDTHDSVGVRRDYGGEEQSSFGLAYELQVSSTSWQLPHRQGIMDHSAASQTHL